MCTSEAFIVISKKLGKLEGMKAIVVVPSDALPQFFKPRPMLIALKAEGRIRAGPLME